jgi:HPt (histidine-containing phosphotransfer) domain-containing protein
MPRVARLLYRERASRRRDMAKTIALRDQPEIVTDRTIRVLDEPIDLEALRSSMDGDVALAREVLTIFLADGPGLLADVRAATDPFDAPALARASHALTGALRAIAATRAASLAERIERAGRGHDGVLAGVVARRLEGELERVLAFIARRGPRLT